MGHWVCRQKMPPERRAAKPMSETAQKRAVAANIEYRMIIARPRDINFSRLGIRTRRGILSWSKKRACSQG